MISTIPLLVSLMVMGAYAHKYSQIRNKSSFGSTASTFDGSSERMSAKVSTTCLRALGA